MVFPMISWGKIPHEGTADNGGRWPHTVRSRIIRGILTLWSHTNSTGVKHDMTMRTNKEEAGTEILKKGGGREKGSDKLLFCLPFSEIKMGDVLQK